MACIIVWFISLEACLQSWFLQAPGKMRTHLPGISHALNSKMKELFSCSNQYNQKREIDLKSLRGPKSCAQKIEITQCILVKHGSGCYGNKQSCLKIQELQKYKQIFQMLTSKALKIGRKIDMFVPVD